MRDRADVRVDHELTGRDSLFTRVSWQRRDPDAFTFESTGGNGGAGLTNLGLLDRQSKAITLAGGWTRIWSGTLVSEFRGGYSSGHAQSTQPFRRRRRWVRSSGSRCRRWRPRCPGFPSFLFSGTNRPSDIRDQRQNAFRDLDQSSFSLSSSATWLKGAHSIKFGGIYSRNYAKDGYSTGANESKGAYAFSGFATGNAFADLLLGLPNEVREQRNTRGDLPMDTFSNDWAVFAQDDVKLTPRLTLFLGLRYEVIGVFVDRNDIYANFVPDRRRPSRRAERRDWRAAASGRRTAGPHAHVGPVRRRPRVDQDRSEQHQPARRLRAAPRQQQQDRAARRVRHLPSDRRRPGRARHHVAQPVPLHDQVHPAAAAAGLLVRHAERVARLRQPGTAAGPGAARTSISTTSRSSASCPAASAPASATSGRR